MSGWGGPNLNVAADTLVRVTTAQPPRPAGHVFVSYVREDQERVDRLVRHLESAGIRVWLDRNDIAPGQDWKAEIRKNIKTGAFAFIGCFSHRSAAKAITVQNEELHLAVEEIRLRPQGATWFIPVRFDDCELPYFDVGGGRTLDSFNRVDLFDGDWPNMGRLVLAIKGTFDTAQQVASAIPVVPTPKVEPSERLPAVLLEASKVIELESLVDDTVDKARKRLNDPGQFPTSSSELDDPDTGLLFLNFSMDDYLLTMRDLLGLLVRGCAYGKQEHEGLWARVIQRIAKTTEHDNRGMAVLQNMRVLPLTLAVYAGSLGAVYRRNYGALRAVAIDPKISSYRGEEAVVSEVHPLVPFAGHVEIVNLALDNATPERQNEPLAAPLINRRSTPGSDYLCLYLAPIFTSMFSVDDEEFTEVFDRTEVMLGLLSENERLLADGTGQYRRESWAGAFIHRQRYRQGYESIDKIVVKELQTAGPQWPPLKAGLFQGSLANAQLAADSYLKLVEEARRRAW